MAVNNKKGVVGNNGRKMPIMPITKKIVPRLIKKPFIKAWLTFEPI
jgi:hypothetical protein